MNPIPFILGLLTLISVTSRATEAPGVWVGDKALAAKNLFITNVAFKVKLTVPKGATLFWSDKKGSFEKSEKEVTEIELKKKGTLKVYAVSDGVSSVTNAYPFMLDVRAPSVTWPTEKVKEDVVNLPLKVNEDYGYWSTNGESYHRFSTKDTTEVILHRGTKLTMYGEDSFGNKSPIDSYLGFNINDRAAIEKTYAFTSVDIGPVEAGVTEEIRPGLDYNLSSYGAGFGYYRDQDAGRFVYRRIKGDFDISCRVESISRTRGVNSTHDAGLMARKNLSRGSLFFGSVVARQPAKDHWQFTSNCRYKPNAKKRNEMMKYGSSDGYYGSWEKSNQFKGKMPFPDIYLRLKREGNVYHGYYKKGKDSDWVEYSRSETMDMGEEPYVGIAISNDIHGGAPNDTCTTAKFRDLTGFPPESAPQTASATR